MCVIEMLGQSTFQVVAVQFGIEQLQGAPSDHLSAFVFWYFMTERIAHHVYQWMYYILHLSLASSFGDTKTTLMIVLGLNLSIAVWTTMMLVVKNCCMLKWFTIGDRIPNDIQIENARSQADKSNPYYLIYNVLKYAQKYKHPAQRSALTYWEDKIPSIIDLGKSKYGSPFTNEEVENVKTFFHLIKLLLSLSGVPFTLISIDANKDSSFKYFSQSKSKGTKLVLIENLSNTATVSLLIFFYFISP